MVKDFLSQVIDNPMSRGYHLGVPKQETHGELVRRLRIKADLSQEELAAKVRATGRAHCTGAWVSLYERGLIRCARGDMVSALCQALDIEPLLFAGPNRPTLDL
jgi:transcriptional regulator with XRE-family HTH domain